MAPRGNPDSGSELEIRDLCRRLLANWTSTLHLVKLLIDDLS